MGRLLLWVLLLALVIVVGGSIYMMFAEPEVAPQRVEKIVPNEKLGR
ncbi:hypothetical protein ACFOMD_06565 [Sphingoaurantiacus capsulatus]|uniref:Uncharacterized protein n=1 Tax=Sphingoaurantiacus capsulatus TaxID=1771310 RepID=A0ABV7XAA3_9SPHN